MVDATPVSLISAFTALVASIAGPFVTLYVARTQMRVTVRSANRQRWIEEFRDLIAQFCSEIAKTSLPKCPRRSRSAPMTMRPSLTIDSRFCADTANKIRLMIDPHEREHRELLASIDALLALFRAGSENGDLQAAGQDMAQRIVGLTVAIVRKEWVRVQKGA